MSLFVPDFSRVKILVVGDLMLDQYWFGPTSRISPEAPVPVVSVQRDEARAGGAANVAMNLVGLGVNTACSGVVGSDANGTELRKLLESAGVQAALLESANHPTISKLRILSRNQQLIRLDTEEIYDPADSAALAQTVARQIASADVCILSDYAKGSLAEVGQLIEQCRDAGVPVLVDPKGTDFECYRGATLITPNRAEFEAVVGVASDEEDLLQRAEALRSDLDLQALVITLSERGMLVVDQEGTTILPARARQVFDVTGAGDTVIATLAAAMGAGLELEAAAGLANLAASLVVAKIGAASVTPLELNLALHEQGEGGRGLLTRDQALTVTSGSRIVDPRPGPDGDLRSTGERRTFGDD